MSDILFITHVGDPGGAEYKMIDLCKALPRSSEVMLLQRGSLERLLEQNDIAFSTCEMPTAMRDFRRSSGILQLFKAIPGAWSLVRGIARKSKCCATVVCMSQKAFVLATLAKPFMRRPIIWFMNDILLPSSFSRMSVRLLLTLSRFSADHVVLNSQASMDVWLKFGGRKARTSIIYPGTDDQRVGTQLLDQLAIAQYRQTLSTDGHPLIGMFGRISRWKGQDVFLRAVARMPAVNAVVVGGAHFDESAYAAELRQLAHDLGISKRVTFTGHLDDVFKVMAACDVVAHCSVEPEPFGQVIVQAMLVETPVVATDTGGAVEIVLRNKTGQLTPPNDPEALAAAIARYLDNPSWALQVAHAAKQWAREKFSSRAMTTDVLRVIESV